VLEPGPGRFDPRSVGRVANLVKVERLAPVTQDA
jgi:hypothetical protein